MNVSKYFLKCNNVYFVVYDSYPELVSYENNILPFAIGDDELRIQIKDITCRLKVDDYLADVYFEYRKGILYYIQGDNLIMVFYEDK